MKDSDNPIEYIGPKTSSAFVLDMRGSTKIIRRLTQSDKTRLKKYTDFLMDLKEILFKELSDNRAIEMTINDTGDGFMCVIWNKKHALRALKMASAIDKYLIDNLPDIEKEIKIDTDFPELEHGIGLHSGSSAIYRYNQNKLSRDFAYGLVINTAARIESLTKVFIDTSFLASGYFIKIFKGQFKNHCVGNFDKWASQYFKKVVTNKIDIRDSKEKGHILYTLKKPVLKLPEK